jgi:hypothetical protein
MAKRVRGSVRPGQRRPIDRRPGAPAQPTSAAGATTSTAKPAGLSEAELARAAELEAALLAEERAATESRQRARERSVTRELGAGTTGSFAAREAIEYAYVARDVKDIVRIAGLLLAILFLLWILIDVTHILPIGG